MACLTMTEPGRLRHLTVLDSRFRSTLVHAQHALYADVVSRGWFDARPDKTRLAWRTVGIVLMVGGLVATIILAASTRLGIIPVPVVLTGLVLAGSARWLPRRTDKGDELAARVLRFGRSIGAEAVAGPGTERAGVLFGYLPYAIIFGCSAAWAALGRAAYDSADSPSWFVGDPSGAALLSQAAQYFSARRYRSFAASGRYLTQPGYPYSGARHSFFGGGFSGGGGSSGGGFGGGGGGSW